MRTVCNRDSMFPRRLVSLEPQRTFWRMLIAKLSQAEVWAALLRAYEKPTKAAIESGEAELRAWFAWQEAPGSPYG